MLQLKGEADADELLRAMNNSPQPLASLQNQEELKRAEVEETA